VAGPLVRLLGKESEVASAAARYLARTDTYSAAKAERLLGWRAAVGLDEGLERTRRWLRCEHLV